MLAAARSAFYPARVVDFVDQKIQDARTGTPPMTAFKDIMDLLEEQKISYKKPLEVEEIQVHPANRGGLGLNAFNAHRNGASIKSIGVDPDELAKAVAFENMPMEPAKSNQRLCNEKLIEGAKGMLSKLTGREKYGSVGTGHCTAFFRAVKAGCRTPQPTLQDAAGNLNAESLSSDIRMKNCLTKGWVWTVLPWQCEVTWPGLPDLAQRALNAGQNVASHMSEFEVCCTIAEFDMLKPEGSTFESCVAAVAMNHPPCKASLSRTYIYISIYQCLVCFQLKPLTFSGAGHRSPI